MVRIAFTVRRSRTGRPSASDSSETTCKLGRKRRLVLLLAWLTLLPVSTPLPVIAHFLAMRPKPSGDDKAGAPAVSRRGEAGARRQPPRKPGDAPGAEPPAARPRARAAAA